VSQLVTRVRCPLETLLVRREPRDTCRDLREWSDSDPYKKLKSSFQVVVAHSSECTFVIMEQKRFNVSVVT